MPTLEQVEAALRACWARDTSDDPDEWTPDNPTRGQCAVSAIVIRELLGGEILMADVHGSHLPGERHAWSRLPDGREVDLTLDQFRAGETLGPAAPDEPYVTDTGVDRGALLLDRVRAWLLRHGPVVLDFDGVIVDTERTWAAVRRDVALRHGGRWQEDSSSAMQGLSTPEWSRYMAEELGVPRTPEKIVDEVLEALLAAVAETPPLLPGAADAIRELAQRDTPLAIASSAPPALLEQVLGAAGLRDAFGVVVSSEQVSRGKPAPDVYLEAARQLGVAPEACTAVEDSGPGLRAAAAAGMTVLAIPNPHDPPDAESLALATRVGPDLPTLLL